MVALRETPSVEPRYARVLGRRHTRYPSKSAKAQTSLWGAGVQQPGVDFYKNGCWAPYL